MFHTKLLLVQFHQFRVWNVGKYPGGEYRNLVLVRHQKDWPTDGSQFCNTLRAWPSNFANSSNIYHNNEDILYLSVG